MRRRQRGSARQLYPPPELTSPGPRLITTPGPGADIPAAASVSLSTVTKLTSPSALNLDVHGRRICSLLSVRDRKDAQLTLLYEMVRLLLVGSVHQTTALHLHQLPPHPRYQNRSLKIQTLLLPAARLARKPFASSSTWVSPPRPELQSNAVCRPPCQPFDACWKALNPLRRWRCPSQTTTASAKLDEAESAAVASSAPQPGQHSSPLPAVLQPVPLS